MSLRKLFSNTVLAVSAIAVFAVGAANAEMPDPAKMPKPTAEHAWLQQFVGEWKSDVKAYMPGQPTPMTSQGTENIEPVGGFWISADNQGSFMNQPFKGVMTLGYDTDKNQYVGTWVDSMTGKLINYTGTLDEAGNKLVLSAETVCPMQPEKGPIKFQETLQLQDKNHKQFTSQMLDPDTGKWVTVMEIQSERTK